MTPWAELRRVLIDAAGAAVIVGLFLWLAMVATGCDVVVETDPNACELQEDCNTANACIDGQCVGYVPVECSSACDCDDGEVCGDNRTCSPTCSVDTECAAVQPWTCGDEQGYCIWPCTDDADCTHGQTCGPDAVCRFGGAM